MKTVVEKLIEQYGVENIFMVAQNYRSYYDDDDCSFKYYNNVTGEFHSDAWTTRYACPPFKSFETTTLYEGIKKGLVDTKKLLEILKTKQLKTVNQYFPAHDIKDGPTQGLRVKVTGGRKWRGLGYFVDTYSVKTGFGVSESYKIYDPMTGRIEYVTPKFVEFIDEEKIKEDYVEEYNRKINECTEEDIKTATGGVCIKPDIESFLEFSQKYTHNIDLSNAYDEVEIENCRKAMEFRTKKMAELFKWAKERANKDDDMEALELATRVFNKNYNSKTAKF